MKVNLLLSVFLLFISDFAFSQDSRTLSGHSGNINSIAFTPDAKHFATGDEDGKIMIWDASSCYRTETINLGANVTCVKYSPDKKFLGASTIEAGSFLLNPDNGSEIARFTNGHRHYSIAFSTNRKFIAVNYFYITDHSNYKNGKEVKYKKFHYEVALCDMNLKLLRTIKVQENDIIFSLFLFDQNLTETYRANFFNSVFTPDSKNLIISDPNGAVVVYDLDKSAVLSKINAHSDKVYNVSLSPDGELLSTASKDGKIKLWKTDKYKRTNTFSKHQSDVNTADFSPDGKYIISTSDDKNIMVWDITTGKMISKLKGFKDDVLCAEFSPDGKYIIGGSKNGKMLVWNTEKIIPEMKIFTENFDAEEISGEYLSEKERLNSNVNSPYSELRPIISPDGKQLYFIRQGHPGNFGKSDPKDQDIWVSDLTLNQDWGDGYNIGEPLNTKTSNHIGSVTPDGNTLVIGGVYQYNGDIIHGISITHRTINGWAFPEKLDIKNFYNDNEYIEYYLSNNGKALLMTIERKDSYGDRDIYVSFLQNDNSWSEPMNLGPTVNSISTEMSPFLAADEKTLYYSSRGKGGYGDADLFITKRLDDSWKNWTEPENMGDLINSDKWDAYYFFPASGEYAYFVSGEYAGDEDIYRIKIPKRVRSEPVFLINGKVTDTKTNLPVDAKIYYETLPDGFEAGVARTNPATGEYKITLPKGKKYGFRAEADGYLSQNDNIDATDLGKYKEVERNLNLVPIEIGETVVLNNIFFNSGKYDLKEESFPELKRVVIFLKENPSIKIQISGHTDDINSDSYNLTLSENRAKSVYSFLTQNGISSDRITFKGYGESKPVATNDTDEGRQLNRRVEFTITGK